MNEPLWSLEEIGAALQLAPPANGRAVQGVSIDSRSLQPDDLFISIKGERSDGHAFIEAAFDKGASAAIAEDNYEAAADRAIFRVPDTLEAMNVLARESRARTDARIVAVTGSAGKTGTKEMLRVMLSATAQTHASEKSYNNVWGVPLSLARMPRTSRFGMFEIGMNHAGEITPLTRMVRPNIAIVTWIAPVHIEFFKSVAEIADAKAEIFEGLEQGGAAILPADNDHFERLAARARAKKAEIVPFGERTEEGAKLLSCETHGDGSRVAASILGSRVGFVLPLPGRHLVSNALAALAAVKLCGADLEAAAAALEGLQAPEGRGRHYRFETQDRPVLLIDETYNANPASMKAALTVLGQVTRTEYSRRVAVLGDMLELGEGGPKYHAELAETIARCDVDLVFCCGPLMQNLYQALPAAKRGTLSKNSEALVPALKEAIRSGDAVTIKGSLGSRMGLIADALRSHFATTAVREPGRSAA